MTKGRVLLILILAAAVAGGYSWRRWGKKAEARSIQEIRVERGDIDLTILTTGEVRPRNRLEIKPPIAGRAEEVLVRDGDQVRKGQILAWMSSTERAALLDAALAKGSDELARWEELYKPTPLVAPAAGLIIARNVEPGQTVTGQDPVLVMSDRLILKGQVDETDVGRVRLHQEVSIVLDAYPGEKVQGHVEHVAYEASTVNNVTIYEVDVLPDRVPPFMRSGMTANLTFLVEKKEGVLFLPVSAVKETGRSTTVQVPGRDGKPEPRAVDVGLSNGKIVEIRSGLAEGDRVLVEGVYRAEAVKLATSPLTPSRGRKPRSR